MDVTLYDISSQDVSRIVWELRTEHDMLVDRDYEYRYYPSQTPRWDDELSRFVRKQTVFTFRDESAAVWFSMKYL